MFLFWLGEAMIWPAFFRLIWVRFSWSSRAWPAWGGGHLVMGASMWLQRNHALTAWYTALGALVLIIWWRNRGRGLRDKAKRWLGNKARAARAAMVRNMPAPRTLAPVPS